MEAQGRSITGRPRAAHSPTHRTPRLATPVTHYWRYDAWLDDGALLRGAGSLAGIPGVMIHGRLDLGSPRVTAWELAQAWPDSDLVVVSGAGHDGRDPGMSETTAAATDRFAVRR